MHLTQAKIKEIESIAFKFKVNPDLFIDALLDVGLKRTRKEVKQEKSIEAILEEVFPGGKWIDSDLLKDLVPIDQLPQIDLLKRVSVYIGCTSTGYPQNWATAMQCAQEGTPNGIKKTKFLGEVEKEEAIWLSLSQAIDIAIEQKYQDVDIYIDNTTIAKQVGKSPRMRDEKIKQWITLINEKLKQLPGIKIHNEPIFTKQMKALAGFVLEKEVGKLRKQL